jgi:hypothetical protein
MGLTIHYGLSSHLRSSDEAKSLIEQLHAKAKELPFAECSELFHLKGKAADFDQIAREDNPEGETLAWLLIQASGRDEQYESVPVELLAFSTWPGEGCEPANFGLCRYRRRNSRQLSDWTWHSFCKTQYASEHGIPHFLKCHLLVCALLETAEKLGLSIEVHDEGDFWEKRDIKALAAEVGSWNQMIAAFIGALEDAMGEPAVAPIKDMPDYEHLEAKGRTEHPNLDQQVRAIASVVSQITQRKCG